MRREARPLELEGEAHRLDVGIGIVEQLGMALHDIFRNEVADLGKVLHFLEAGRRDVDSD